LRLNGWIRGASTLGDRGNLTAGNLILRRHRHAGPDAFHSIDDDFLARQQAGSDDPRPSTAGPSFTAV